MHNAAQLRAYFTLKVFFTLRVNELEPKLCRRRLGDVCVRADQEQGARERLTPTRF